MPGKGRGLHFRTSVRLPERAHLFYSQTPCKISASEAFHPNPSQTTTSIPTSSKPTKIKHFTTFHSLQKSKSHTQNPIKPL